MDRIEIPNGSSKADNINSSTTLSKSEFLSKYSQGYELFTHENVKAYLKDAFAEIEKADKNTLFNEKEARKEVIDTLMGLSEVSIDLGSSITTLLVRRK